MPCEEETQFSLSHSNNLNLAGHTEFSTNIHGIYYHLVTLFPTRSLVHDVAAFSPVLGKSRLVIHQRHRVIVLHENLLMSVSEQDCHNSFFSGVSLTSAASSACFACKKHTILLTII